MTYEHKMVPPNCKILNKVNMKLIIQISVFIISFNMTNFVDLFVSDVLFAKFCHILRKTGSRNTTRLSKCVWWAGFVQLQKTRHQTSQSWPTVNKKINK